MKNGFPSQSYFGLEIRKVVTLFLLAALGVVATANAQNASELLKGKVSFKGGVFPLYSGNTPAALLRVERNYVAPQRRGFFTVGVLPAAVLEGVTFEIVSDSVATNSLAQLQHWISASDARALDLRQVTFKAAGFPTNHLHCAAASIGSAGKWKLMDVRLQTGTNQVHAHRATLQLTGERPGELVLEMSPPSTNNLFPLLFSHSSNHRNP